MVDIDGDMRGGCSEPPVERRVGDLATRQHGVVARRQLPALGLSLDAIDRRVRAGRLIVLHHGVYAVGHTALSQHGIWMAAVLAYGDGAVLSHRPAAAAHGILRSGGRPHVTTPRSRRPRPGIAVHVSRTLDARDVTCVGRIPVTTWARTIVDLADLLTADALARALEQATIARLYDYTELLDAMARSPGRLGAGRLRDALALGDHLSPQLTRSLLEERFLSLVRAADPPLMRMRANAWLPGIGEIDALWQAQGVAVELDGERFHDHVGARRRDAAKDVALAAAGYRVLRFTWHDVTARPGVVLRRLRHALGRQG